MNDQRFYSHRYPVVGEVLSINCIAWAAYNLSYVCSMLSITLFFFLDNLNTFYFNIVLILVMILTNLRINYHHNL